MYLRDMQMGILWSDESPEDKRCEFLRSLETLQKAHTSLHSQTMEILKMSHPRDALRELYLGKYEVCSKSVYTEIHCVWSAVSKLFLGDTWKAYNADQAAYHKRVYGETARLMDNYTVVPELARCQSYYQVRNCVLCQKTWTPSDIIAIDRWFIDVHAYMWPCIL